ncbi:MAG TPA: S8 family peptidase [Longimicrobium sp.]|jgi:subtilisin family serine protease|uniref:S8 family peptidase n=1 Tax=Longimicrobium sp. TaxID=2029185 RepID=UPI002EDB3585
MRALRSTALLAAAAALAACADQTPAGARAADAAPLRSAQAGHGVEGQYIVVLHEGADPRSVAAVAGVSPRLVYTSALNGFAAALNQGQLNALRHNPQVDYVEQDQVGGIAVTQSPATWGLDRIDQRPNALNNAYVYNTTAGAVRAYVIDSGIYTAHAQFGTRAQNVYDYAGGSGADCNGHGTHVAGTIGSTTYGVAKGVLLRGVRVVDCNGYGTTSVVTAAIDWVRLNHLKPAVANMSLAYPYSAAVNTAATNLVNAGVYTAVASGNANADACNTSPASASGTLSTNAVGSNGARATFSNWGACTDLYAPGVSVTSTWHNGGTSVLSGTSMASPHVAGVAALYKATYGDLTSVTITNWILNNASNGYVTGNPAGTPNRVLYKAAM